MIKLEQIATGVKVKYFPLLQDKTTYTVHEIRSEPWKVCGEDVVKISDKAGGVSIEHLELV